jgi:hypothetical protein
MKDIIKKILKEDLGDDWDWVREHEVTIYKKDDFKIGVVGSWFYELHNEMIEDCEVVFIDDENCAKTTDCVVVRITKKDTKKDIPHWPCNYEIPDDGGRCLYPQVNKFNPFIVKNYKK